MSRTFCFQQNDTKMNDFDEGVLILEPFFWGNVIFKMCTVCIKSHVWGREEFLWVAPPDRNAAKLRNEFFSHEGFALQSKSRHFTRGSQTISGKFSVRKLWLLRSKGKSWKLHYLRKTAIESKRLSSKLTILVSCCCNNWHNFFILSLVFLKLLIVSVAFFLGHPV